MRAEELVKASKRGPVAVLTLNRPEALNALNRALMNELADALEEAADETEVRAVVISGSERAFCAGADIKELTSLMAEPLNKGDSFGSHLFELLEKYPKPTIAAVCGLALGGGCEIALSCDIVVAGESARFGLPEVKLGVIPGAGGTQRIVWALGKAKGMRALLSGESISAQDAFIAGLVSEVVPDERCLEAAIEIGEVIAANAPIAVRLAKESASRVFETSLHEGLALERRAFQLLLTSADMAEGVSAFIEKRRPTYRGQ